MNILKFFRFLHLLCYLCVTSQALFYLLVFSDALKLTSITNFLEQRKAIEQMIAGRYMVIYFVCLILSLVVVFISYRINDRVFLITSLVSLFCLLIDLSIAIAGNIPINKQIHQLTTQMNHSQWEVLRANWLRFFSFRGVFTTIGMLSLLIGLLIEKKHNILN